MTAIEQNLYELLTRQQEIRDMLEGMYYMVLGINVISVLTFATIISIKRK